MNGKDPAIKWLKEIRDREREKMEKGLVEPMFVDKPSKAHEIAQKVADLVTEKNKQYGDAYGKCGEFLRLLYPDGIAPEQYRDALCLVRMFDKQMRIAHGYYEDSYTDLLGYSLLGALNFEKGVKDAKS